MKNLSNIHNLLAANIPLNSEFLNPPEESPKTGILILLFDFVSENVNLYKIT